MSGLVLSLFPGLDLFGEAFTREGFVVVRGPDILFGSDVADFHPPRGVFDGVIGGPPCQFATNLHRIRAAGRQYHKPAVDLIGEFMRIVRESGCAWAVMENVINARRSASAPSWHAAILRDWDCGGETMRRRAFWSWPFCILDPVPRPGKPEHTVMVSTGRRGGSRYVSDKYFLPGNLPLREYERLQGAPGIVAALEKAGASRRFAIHLLGNAVPLAMGGYIARHVRAQLRVRDEGPGLRELAEDEPERLRR